jgi:hypothetical protein
VNVAGCWIENQRSRARGCMITPRTLTHWNGGTYKPHTPPQSRFYVSFSYFFFILFILSFLFSFFSSCFLLISIYSSLSTPSLSRSLFFLSSPFYISSSFLPLLFSFLFFFFHSKFPQTLCVSLDLKV